MQIIPNPDSKRTLFIKFPYNPSLIKKIKNMEGAKWVSDKKVWSISNSTRNHNNLLRIINKPTRYDKYTSTKIKTFPTTRKVYPHQQDFVNLMLSLRQFLIVGDMGTGKSLAFIEAAELSGYQNIWYVGPKSAVKSVELELEKWNAKFKCSMFTYSAFTNKTDDLDLPEFLFLDESSCVKDLSSQRSKKALEIASEMYKLDPNRIVILASGTPAPKNPLDWFSQYEIICEGYIPESTASKLEQRLAKVSYSDGDTPYPINEGWIPEELEKFAKELSPLRTVVLKKDVMKDLPDKRYEVVKVKPTVEMLRAAKMIKESGDMPVQILTKLRTISDGFMYEFADGTEKQKCPRCLGVGQDWDPEEDEMKNCPDCNGEGMCFTKIRVVSKLKTPKDEALFEIMERNEPVGKLVVWGGFTGTIDRLEEVIRDKGWKVLVIDGRGYRSKDGDPKELLKAMDASHALSREIDKLAVVAHPGAGGMGLTFTAAHTEVFYSNDFAGQSRFQAEDRIHRIGMNISICPTIIDICCLPCDTLVLENLKLKKDLQKITMEDIDNSTKSDTI